MHLRPKISAPVFASALAGFFSAAAASPPATSQTTLAAAYNGTGQRLFQGLTQGTGNIVISPYSIGSALSLALAGARGATEKEMSDALGLPFSAADLDAAYARLASDLESASGKDGATLNSANALVEVKPDVVDAAYRARLQKNYGAEAFPGQVEAINQWIAQKTAGKISHLLDSLPGDTGVVLVNAAYFKGLWQYPFPKAATEDGTFHLTATADAQVPMMHIQDHFALVKGPDFKAIRLPYRSSDARLAMIVVIPNAVDGLAALTAELGPEQIARLRADLNAADFPDVRLQLPRFHASFKASLATAIEKLGMPLAFSLSKADFSGITGRPPAALQVAIGDVIHAAVIDVNEESAEAAAATAVEMTATAMAPQYEPPVEPFIVDRPFLFFIADAETGAVLFQGRILDPRA